MTPVSDDFVLKQTDGAAPTVESAEYDALEDAGLDPAAVADKTYSFRMLLEAGVSEPIADALRRRFSLPWSFGVDGDLDKRSNEVSGLAEAEREWVAASADESWQAFESARYRAAANESNEPIERPWPRPTPVTAVTGIGPEHADRLADAGIISAERLATIDASAVASALDIDVRLIRTWRHNARRVVNVD